MFKTRDIHLDADQWVALEGGIRKEARYDRQRMAEAIERGDMTRTGIWAGYLWHDMRAAQAIGTQIRPAVPEHYASEVQF